MIKKVLDEQTSRNVATATINLPNEKSSLNKNMIDRFTI